MAGYAAMVYEQFTALGYDTRLYGHADSRIIADQLPVLPVFGTGSFDMVTPDGSDPDQDNFFEAAKRIALDVLALSRQWGPDPDQVILVNTTEPLTLHAMALWRINSPAPDWPLFINMGLGSGLTADPGHLGHLGRRAQYFQYAFQLFDPSAPLHLFTHTEAEVKDYGFLSNRRVVRVPWAVLNAPDINRDMKCSAGGDNGAEESAFRVLMPGAGHEAQNSRILGAVVASLSARDAGACHFVMQGPVQTRQTRQQGPHQFDLLLRGLCPDAYVRLFAEADCCLLPYQPQAYRAMMSGQFALAAAHGLPSIVPAHTTMSAEGAGFPKAVLPVDVTDPDAIADAIIQVRNTLSETRAAARAFQHWFRARHGPEQHCRVVHGLIQEYLQKR